MENNYSNYDMFDKLIANNKKAKTWTVLWITALCLLAAAVLWMAFNISEKNKTINQQELALQTQEEFLETKNHLIDSLVANCNVSKNEIVNTYDSVIAQTENAIKTIVNTNIDSGKPLQITERQQTRLKEVSKSIQYVKTNLDNVKMDIRKPITRLFIQYNNKNNIGQVERLSEILKNNSNYYIAPAEYIDNNFPMVIKFYNYENAEEENLLKNIIARQFDLDPQSIPVNYENNDKIKSTVEIWIGTRHSVTRQTMIRN